VPGIAEGDRVVSCFTSRGTFFGEFHRAGEYQGTPMTGRNVSVKGVDIFQICDGKITDVRVFYDTYDQMQQLGFIPSLESSGRELS
jgi:predicted ester cyclase